ncbi:calcium-activated chloride channel regulator 4-like [Sapajus apella]|uniref:Calcium-activated chloride channel regulator 4-like n=1 Tax=Sapajus apella TaxID=9515 RepID=A0A6J3JCV4_SAPAP|nr:calcium-activated chloride channel regulator 4-like [Sapajus apella]
MCNAGEIEANPPRPENNEDTQFTLENFSQTASGGAFVVSQVPSLPLPDLYLPSQITDLDAIPHEDEIVLTWTAPGDDFDVGKVQHCIISGSILDLRDSFDDALQVNTTDLSQKEANSKEIFAFKPGNISEENATHIFIAIKSIHKSNLTSEVSSIAQVALFIPQANPDKKYTTPAPDKNYTLLFLTKIILLLFLIKIIILELIFLPWYCLWLGLL